MVALVSICAHSGESGFLIDVHAGTSQVLLSGTILYTNPVSGSTDVEDPGKFAALIWHGVNGRSL